MNHAPKPPFFIIFSIAILALMGLSSCVPLAVGAAGGYMLKKEGYEVQPPITRE